MSFLESKSCRKSLLIFQQNHIVYQGHWGPLAWMVSFFLSQEAQTIPVCFSFMNTVFCPAFGPCSHCFFSKLSLSSFSYISHFLSSNSQLPFLLLRKAFHEHAFTATLKLCFCPLPHTPVFPHSAKHGMLTSLCQSLEGKPQMFYLYSIYSNTKCTPSNYLWNEWNCK